MKKIAINGTAAILFFWHAPVFSYIDPGSGSAIMSAIIGLFVAMGLAIKTYWYKIKSFFVKPNNTEDDSDADS